MHVLLNVLGFDKDDGTVLALRQFWGKPLKVADILHMEAADLNNLSYKPLVPNPEDGNITSRVTTRSQSSQSTVELDVPRGDVF